MSDIEIIRVKSSDQGTEGVALARGGFRCRSIELPWRDNKPNISCIPAKQYKAILRKSGHFGLVYALQDVSGRSGILIHSGNVAGDTSKGYKSNSYGCILFGKHSGTLYDQAAVLLSRATVRRFMAAMEGRSMITISITEVF